MDTGTIFGRSPNVVIGVLMATYNSAVAFHIGGFAPTMDQTATVNILFSAIIAFVANVPQIAVAGGIKAITRLNNAAPIGKMPGTDLANKISNGDGFKVVNSEVK